MQLKPKDVLELTHKEFIMLSEENVNRTHDMNEQAAMTSIMSAAASRGKGKKGKLPSVSDLYKRPSDDSEAETEENLRQSYEDINERLSHYDLDSLERNKK